MTVGLRNPDPPLPRQRRTAARLAETYRRLGNEEAARLEEAAAVAHQRAEQFTPLKVKNQFQRFARMLGYLKVCGIRLLTWRPFIFNGQSAT